MERERETDRHTHTQTDTQTDTERNHASAVSTPLRWIFKSYKNYSLM